jgi:predicted nucleotidyltransferase
VDALSLIELKNRLESLKADLRKRYNVKTIGLFGSYVRGEQKTTSDLDVLVEFYEPISLFHFVELEDFLSQRLGVKVDLVMRDSLKPRIKDSILNEAVYV